MSSSQRSAAEAVMKLKVGSAGKELLSTRLRERETEIAELAVVGEGGKFGDKLGTGLGTGLGMGGWEREHLGDGTRDEMGMVWGWEDGDGDRAGLDL